MNLHRFRLAVPLAMAVLFVDCSTKELAVEVLAAEHQPRQVAGDLVRFTLVYNSGAAMSLPVGPYARGVLLTLGAVVLAVLIRLLWQTPPSATWRRVALGLLLGGAMGNLASRAFSPQGVVDFIDIGLGANRFYLFNVADVGITIGALLLAHTLWREESPGALPPAT